MGRPEIGRPAAGLFGSEQMIGSHRRTLAPVKTAFVVSISFEGAATTATVVRAPLKQIEENI
jgi:hypothetical protein